MMKPLLRSLVLASAFALAVSPARAVTYTATLLDPNNDLQTSRGLGAANSVQVGIGYSPDFTGGAHALKWNGTPASLVDLNPNTFTATNAAGTTATQQVGDGYGPTTTGNNPHALVWSGTAASLVDLTPTGFDFAYGKGIAVAANAFGSTQVGYGSGSVTTGDNNHALLWTGTAASRVDLHPAGFTESFAFGVSGSNQVGYGYGSSTSDNDHALLWTGTAASKIDLNPSGFTTSHANGVYVNGSVTKQVGDGAGTATGGDKHALLWSGTAASKVDLNPSGFSFSEALAVSGAGQVGDGIGPSDPNNHALYWNGSAANYVDLHESLLGDTGVLFVSSYATGIAENGDIVGYAFDDGFFEHAVLWKATNTTPPDTGVTGDYNNDGKVDAADYITWRKGNTPLHNEVATIGSNTPEDYTAWRARFGNITGSGSTLGSQQVPEPAPISICCITAFAATAVARLRCDALSHATY